MQKIHPSLWFNDNAEDAVKFYLSVFKKKSKVVAITRYGEAGPGPKGSALTIAFKLEGERFIAINGGPDFSYTPALSLVVNCETQREVDYYWKKLTAGGGAEQPCGWLTDKFGVSWQITPVELPDMLRDKNADKANRVMQAMLQMKKLDIKALKRAYKGK